MDIETDIEANKIFKRRCPTQAVCCPIHERRICVKYVQPEIPQSFRPTRSYEGPISPMASDTVHHMSYRNLDPRGARPLAAKFPTNIGFSNEPLEASTTMGLSYMGVYEQPPKSYRPELVYEGPIAPLQEMTTQRHDYPKKPIQCIQQVRPHTNIHKVSAKMDGRSITMESYMPVGNPVPPKSFKPVKIYEAPTRPLESDTITQSSYQQPKMTARETYSWMKRANYQMPEEPMDENTIYNNSYVAPGIFEKCCDDPQECPPEICYCNIPKADEDL